MSDLARTPGEREDWLRSYHTLPTPARGDAPATVLAHLVRHFPQVTEAGWVARLAEGRVRWDDGTPLGVDEAFAAGRRLVYAREVPDEPPPAEPLRILHADEHIAVIDKPHGVPVTPTGRYLRRSLLYQARRLLDNPELVAAHRLDLETAGLVLCVQRPEDRAVYHGLFAARRMHKAYAAIGWGRGEPPAFTTVRSRIESTEDRFRWRSVPDPDGGAVSDVYRVGRVGSAAERLGDSSEAASEGSGGSAGAWRFRVVPESGRPHQIRLHLAALGFPLIGDPLYPERRRPRREEGPLRLLAEELRFRDPFAARWCSFRSERQLGSS